MVIYLCGPMTGLPDFNVNEFNKIAKALEKDKHTIINPADLNKLYPNQSWEFYMEKCIYILSNVDIDMVILLDGWEKSKGVLKEIETVKKLPYDVKICEYKNLIKRGKN